jgi:hypothetical protein
MAYVEADQLSVFYLQLLIGDLSREEVEFVVSSEFSLVYVRAQEGITRVYSKKIIRDSLVNERSKYSRCYPRSSLECINLHM